MSYRWITKYNSPNFTPKSAVKRIFGYDRKIDGYTLHWWGDPATKPSFEGDEWGENESDRVRAGFKIKSARAK